MGANMVRRYLIDAEVEPDPLNIPTFESELGFEQRKERRMIATQQQMNDAMVPLDLRDYCAHYYIKFLKCRRDKAPNIFACRGPLHDWESCEYQDYVMRMKEFERERRLLVRKKRLKQKLAEKQQGPLSSAT